MVKREISSDKNWKEAFWETALSSVNSLPRVTAFPSRSRSLRLFLWKLQRDISKPIEAYGEKENVLRWKLERSFLRNCFVIWEFHSLSYSFISWSRWPALFLWNLRTDISDPFEVYNAKGNILQSKWERSFLRNFFMICEIISQSYSFPFQKPFAKTVFVEFAKVISKPRETYGEKENILRWTLERSFLSNCFVMWDFHSLSYRCISWSCLLALFLWNLRTDISDPFEYHRAKGNTIQ